MEASERLGAAVDRLEDLLPRISGSSTKGVPDPAGVGGVSEAPGDSVGLVDLKDQILARLTEFRAAELICFRQYEARTSLQHVLQLDHPLPPTRGWAASPDVLLRLYTEVRERLPHTVVEVGSGVSTLVIGDALRANGTGRLISLEHDAGRAHQTTEGLVREGLDDVATVYHAALAPWEAPDAGDHPHQAWKWYDLGVLEAAALVAEVDLVFVDGPPARTQRWSRYPALPALRQHLKVGSLVLLDDAIRQEERDIADAWSRDYGMSLEIEDRYEKGLAVLEFPH